MYSKYSIVIDILSRLSRSKKFKIKSLRNKNFVSSEKKPPFSVKTHQIERNTRALKKHTKLKSLIFSSIPSHTHKLWINGKTWWDVVLYFRR